MFFHILDEPMLVSKLMHHRYVIINVRAELPCLHVAFSNLMIDIDISIGVRYCQICTVRAVLIVSLAINRGHVRVVKTIRFESYF